MEKLIQIQGPNVLRQLILATIITAAWLLIHNEQLFTHYMSIAVFEVCEIFSTYLILGGVLIINQLLVVAFSENG